MSATHLVERVTIFPTRKNMKMVTAVEATRGDTVAVTACKEPSSHILWLFDSLQFIDATDEATGTSLVPSR